MRSFRKPISQRRLKKRRPHSFSAFAMRYYSIPPFSMWLDTMKFLQDMERASLHLAKFNSVPFHLMQGEPKY